MQPTCCVGRRDSNLSADEKASSIGRRHRVISTYRGFLQACKRTRGGGCVTGRDPIRASDGLYLCPGVYCTVALFMNIYKKMSKKIEQIVIKKKKQHTEFHISFVY
jgi:hypothetical protein